MNAFDECPNDNERCLENCPEIKHATPKTSIGALFTIIAGDYERCSQLKRTSRNCKGPQQKTETIYHRFQRIRKRLGLNTTAKIVEYECMNPCLSEIDSSDEE